LRPRRRSLRTVGLSATVILGFSLAVQVPAGAAEQTPGTRPSSTPSRSAPHALEAAASGGLQLKVNERGHLSRSIAGVTSDTTGGGTLTMHKPAGATVRRAYLAIATTGFTNTPLGVPVTLDGSAVPMTTQIPTGIQSYNYFADVTSMVKAKLDGAPAGQVTFTVAEPQPDLTDGEIAVVIYDDPAVTVDQTVSILYGSLNPNGDQYQLNLAGPINKADPNTHLEMSLGISYSFQTGGAQQYSIVDVDGQRLTTSAGGEDDGLPHNGALLTVGGDGDSIDNPSDPNATPTNPRSDDELYNLLPFVHDGDRQITVKTSNPSLDDNVLLATFTMNPPVTSISTGSGPAYVGVGDSTTTGFSVPRCQVNRTTSPYGCVGNPPAPPYPDRISSANSRFTDEARVGIWGYTIHEAVVDASNGHNVEGPWTPQLLAAAKAQRLVTVSLGANDMDFRNYQHWLGVCVAKQFTTLLRSTCLDAATAKAESIRPDVQTMMNRLDAAAAGGAQVAITLYYNPYNTVKEVGPFGILNRDCTMMWAISEIITDSLNLVLAQEAVKHHFTLAPLAPEFVGHGAGAKDSYVFGSDCDIIGAASAVKFRLGWPPINGGATNAELEKKFDPHPNAKGTQAQADQILQVVN
jgi:lysophospholipase L1-like esterase